MHTRNRRTMTNVDHANLSCKQHCPHRVHFTQQMTVQNTAERTLDLKEAGELWATTWKMFCVDLVSHCVTYTLRPGNSAVLGKQWLKTKAHGAVPCCYLSQAAICKNCHCK